MPRFFGQYLLEKGLVNREQLLKALEYQRSKVRKLGEIAIQREYLSEKDVEAIHQEQRKTDLMFGELAVRKGLLTQVQVNELMNIQKSSHVYLGEALTALGILADKQVQQELNLFREEEKEEVAVEVHVPDDLPKREFLVIIWDLTIKLLRRVADLLVKTCDVKLEKGYTVNSFLCVMIQLKGGFQGKILLNLSGNVAHRIAQTMTGSQSPPPDPGIVADACGEFLNILCGQIVTRNVMETGKSIDLSVPKAFYSTEREVIPYEVGERGVVFPLFTQEGFAELQIVGNL